MRWIWKTELIIEIPPTKMHAIMFSPVHNRIRDAISGRKNGRCLNKLHTFTLSPMRAFLSIIALLMWESFPIPIGTLPFAAKNLLSVSVWSKQRKKIKISEQYNQCAEENIPERTTVHWNYIIRHHFLIIICSHQQCIFYDCTFWYARP